MSVGGISVSNSAAQFSPNLTVDSPRVMVDEESNRVGLFVGECVLSSLHFSIDRFVFFFERLMNNEEE